MHFLLLFFTVILSFTLGYSAELLPTTAQPNPSSATPTTESINIPEATQKFKEEKSTIATTSEPKVVGTTRKSTTESLTETTQIFKDPVTTTVSSQLVASSIGTTQEIFPDATKAFKDDATTTATVTRQKEEATTIEATTDGGTTTRTFVPMKDDPCVDGIYPLTGKSDCPKNKKRCQKKKYVTVMKRVCPLTCGYCKKQNTTAPTKGSDNCIDTLSLNGQNACINYKQLCKDPRNGSTIRELCPRTCGVCKNGNNGGIAVGGNNKGNGNIRVGRQTGISTSCRDSPTVFGSFKCHQMKTRCDEDLMRDKCPLTCGYCIQLNQPVCRDRSTSCRAANCDVPSIQDYMADMCPVTCKKCDAATGRFF